MISENKKDLLVIGIMEIAGQVNRTLAQLIYEREEVIRYFEKKIWVYASDDFCEERILRDML